MEGRGMNPKVLPAEAWAVVKSLGSTDLLNGWILAGGTALALQLGHRVSVDLDFFHHEDFEVPPLREALAGLGKFEVSAMAPGTLHCRLDDILPDLPALGGCLSSTSSVPYRGLHLADVRRHRRRGESSRGRREGRPRRTSSTCAPCSRGQGPVSPT